MGHLVLVFDRDRHRNPLRERKPAHEECEHYNVELDEQAKAVTCQACGKVLDAFWYLCLLAREWSLRAYRDAKYQEAYEALRQQQHDAMARGKLFRRPAGGAGMRAWDVFTAYWGREPFSIYRRGSEWYSAEQDGVHISEHYAAMILHQHEVEALS